MKIFILLLMIFLHIVDDYYLQGILSKLKQKSWWKESASNEIYKHDYVMALLEHAFSWTFMIMLPIAIMNKLDVTIGFMVVFIINMITHTIVDNLKANKGVLNLVQDQLIHLIQVLLTWALWVVII